ncbi:MAG TPA: N-acyl homoserine lactonase family protein [Xanthobacteraceae bacterium]|nr:N-acyl homoserine lactonase family protein [Xanthobacteraceae bacterium]
MPADSNHEIYAIRYARHDRSAKENFIDTDVHDFLQPLDYFVWAIVGASGAFIVDTGFDTATANRRGRIITRPIRDGLQAAGIDANKITNVIVTHLHYDHCGNYELFPQATYHLQDCEMAYATGRCMCEAHYRIPFEADDVVDMVRKVFAGRVTFHEGESRIAPGISVHKIGGHSKGLQCVRVDTRRGPVVLASDATHLYQHVAEGRVYPIYYDIPAVLAGYAKLKKLAGDIHHIIPGHDPKVLDLYPAPRSELKGWIARVDVAENA